MTSVNYSCTVLAGTNKVGKLKADSNGYYEMIVGAVAMENSAGQFYEGGDDVLALFGPGSSLHRRISNGQCRAELGHPKKEPGMSMNDYVQRILSIEEKNVCAHFKSVRLDSNLMKDDKGNPVIATIAMVKPSGPQGTFLKESMENHEENVAFSIRSLTANRIVGGRMHKKLQTVVGWDQVNEGGISIANKYDSPALEDYSEDSILLVPEYLDQIDRTAELHPVGLESNGISTTMLRTELGWQKVQKIELASNNW